MTVISIRGGWNGSVELDLISSSVLDLKNAISTASGIPIDYIKILCSGKTLNDDSKALSSAGISESSKIMVLRQKLSPKGKTDENRVLNTSAVFDAAGALGKEMALESNGANTRRLQLTNQNGEAINIDESDRSALVEGMVLHSRARKILKRTLNGSYEDLIRGRKEALEYLLGADAAFLRCNLATRRMVDNHAYICLDAAWLLFLSGEMANLQQATSLLRCASEGFEQSHGPDLARLKALKGEHCPEFALYARLHVLQGVVSLLSGDEGKAYGLLLRAKSECSSLCVQASDVRNLQRYEMENYGEVVSYKLASRALRAGKGSLSGAKEFLLMRRERLSRVKQWDAIEKLRQRFGRTADSKSYVDPELVVQLISMGVSEHAAKIALRDSNNSLEKAIRSLRGEIQPSETGIGEEKNELKSNSNVEENRPVRNDDSSLQIESSDYSICENRRDRNNEVAGQKRDIDRNLVKKLKYEATEDDDEDYLDLSLREEALAAEMYLSICAGHVPLQFDMDKIRGRISSV